MTRLGNIIHQQLSNRSSTHTDSSIVNTATDKMKRIVFVAAMFVLTLMVISELAFASSQQEHRNRVKRQYADLHIGQHQANMGLYLLRRCKEFGCGVINPAYSGKRSLRSSPPCNERSQRSYEDT